jgi:hypothetical protein
MTFAARMQHRIYWGWLKKVLEASLKTWLAPWAYIASVIYHDAFWYPFRGRARVQGALDSKWGRLFHNWDSVQSDDAGYPEVGEARGTLVRNLWGLLRLSLRILWTCIREAPEIKVRKRKTTSVS